MSDDKKPEVDERQWWMDHTGRLGSADTYEAYTAKPEEWDEPWGRAESSVHVVPASRALAAEAELKELKEWAVKAGTGVTSSAYDELTARHESLLAAAFLLRTTAENFLASAGSSDDHTDLYDACREFDASQGDET